MGFYDNSFAKSLKHLTAFNFGFQIAYYLILNKFMFMKSVRLFNFFRILGFYLLSEVTYNDLVVRDMYTKEYRVNINDLFDLDE